LEAQNSEHLPQGAGTHTGLFSSFDTLCFKRPPDGLEKVAETLGVEEQETATGLMPDYTVPVVENDYSSS
jgi:hypothetical protein